MVPEVAGSNPVFHPKREQSRTPKVFGFFFFDIRHRTPVFAKIAGAALDLCKKRVYSITLFVSYLAR